MNHKRYFSLLILGLVLAITLGACTVPDVPGVDSVRAPESDLGVEIAFVHALRDDNRAMVDALVASFNESHEGVTVVAESTGSYAQTLAQALDQGAFSNPPALVHIYDLGVQAMIDSGATVSLNTLSQDDADLDGMIGPIRDYYSVDGELLCMPFNNSTSVLYYNKDLLASAGLEPEALPTTWIELEEYSRSVMDEGVATGGFSMGWPAWVLEQSYAMHNQPFANNSNGRTSLATEVNLSNKFGVSFGIDLLTVWQRMARNGVLVYGGRTYNATDPFLEANFPYLIQSTSSLPTILREATFEVGTAPLPRMAGYGGLGNNVVTGGCIWVMKSASPEEQAAAWEFLQFLYAPAQSVALHKMTGYLPSNQRSVNMLEQEEWFDQKPDYFTGIEQLLNGSATPAATGALLGNYIQIRDLTSAAIEEILFDEVNISQVLDQASREIRLILGAYAGIPVEEIETVVETASSEALVLDSEAVDEGKDGGPITFWHAMSGTRSEVVDSLVNNFNELYPDTPITAEYTGSYAETLTAAMAAYEASENAPTIVQVYEVGTQTMLDSSAIVPVHTLNQGEVDWDEVVEPIMNYYSIDGELYCMPFNSSTAMLYYNKDMLEAAELDPELPPVTWAEVEDYSRVIMDAGVAAGGFSMGWPAWIFEQAFATHDQLYANNNNGRSDRADEVLFNGEFGAMVMSEWQRMAEDGVLVYGGRRYAANDPFLAQEFPFLFQSTSSLGDILAIAEFEVGTAFLPLWGEEYDAGNSVVGGGCLWLLDSATPEQQEVAWEFFKHTFTPERAIVWHKNTGYFPTSDTAFEMLKDEGWFENEPNHMTAFDQILGGANTPAATGVLLGDFVQIRDVVGTAIEEILVEGTDPQEILDAAAEETNNILADYSKGVE